jgi:hypothetical protein
MRHPDLFPAPHEIAALQQAIEDCALSENELMLLLSAGARLAGTADPTDSLDDVIWADAENGDAAAPLNAEARRTLLATIERASPVQRRALAILALQKTWSDEGNALPEPGLTADT